LVTHRRIAEAEHQRVMLSEHRPPRGQQAPRPDPHPEENAILTVAPEVANYVAGLKQKSRKVITLALRQLLRFVREYPRQPLLGAVREAQAVSCRLRSSIARDSHQSKSMIYI
jgi:hypothetical protein